MKPRAIALGKARKTSLIELVELGWHAIKGTTDTCRAYFEPSEGTIYVWNETTNECIGMISNEDLVKWIKSKVSAK